MRSPMATHQVAMTPGYSYPGFHDTPFFFPTTVYHLYHHLAHQRQPLPPLCTAGDHICAIQREPWDVTERDEMMWCFLRKMRNGKTHLGQAAVSHPSGLKEGVWRGRGCDQLVPAMRTTDQQPIGLWLTEKCPKCLPHSSVSGQNDRGITGNSNLKSYIHITVISQTMRQWFSNKWTKCSCNHCLVDQTRSSSPSMNHRIGLYEAAHELSAQIRFMTLVNRMTLYPKPNLLGYEWILAKWFMCVYFPVEKQQKTDHGELLW